MTFCIFSKEDVVARYRREKTKRDKKMMFRVLCELTAASEKEMIEFLKEAGVYEREKQPFAV